MALNMKRFVDMDDGQLFVFAFHFVSLRVPFVYFDFSASGVALFFVLAPLFISMAVVGCLLWRINISNVGPWLSQSVTGVELHPATWLVRVRRSVFANQSRLSHVISCGARGLVFLFESKKKLKCIGRRNRPEARGPFFVLGIIQIKEDEQTDESITAPPPSNEFRRRKLSGVGLFERRPARTARKAAGARRFGRRRRWSGGPSTPGFLFLLASASFSFSSSSSSRFRCICRASVSRFLVVYFKKVTLCRHFKLFPSWCFCYFVVVWNLDIFLFDFYWNFLWFGAIVNYFLYFSRLFVGFAFIFGSLGFLVFTGKRQLPGAVFFRWMSRFYAIVSEVSVLFHFYSVVFRHINRWIVLISLILVQLFESMPSRIFRKSFIGRRNFHQ